VLPTLKNYLKGYQENLFTRKEYVNQFPPSHTDMCEYATRLNRLNDYKGSLLFVSLNPLIIRPRPPLPAARRNFNPVSFDSNIKHS
jgi:hypothetical protein